MVSTLAVKIVNILLSPEIRLVWVENHESRSMMDLIVLREKMRAHRALLESMTDLYPEIDGVLHQLNELFVKIDSGTLMVPCEDCYRTPFHPDVHIFYGPGTALSIAESEFICALEDWPSKPWFQALSNVR